MKVLFMFYMLLSVITGCQDERTLNESSGIPVQENYKVEVDKMPMPVGGMKAIQENIVYPEEAREKNIEGKVFVKAFVDESGNVNSLEVIQGIDPLLDKAALDALKKVKFSPAYKNDKPVKAQVVIPIMFKLNGDSKKDSDQDIKKNTDDVKKDGEYFIEADEMPQIIGGIRAITEKIVYPESEKKAGVQGQVLVAIYIDEKGNIEKKEIEKGVNDALNKASLAALEGIKFTPGISNGKNVKTKVMLPVNFKLQ